MLPPPRRLFVRSAAFVTVLLLGATLATAQTGPTADDLFDDSVLHEIRLAMNPRDWDSLQANFQLNDYYPSHLSWNGVTARNIGVRSRGVGSRSGTKPGLLVDFDYYSKNQTFLGLTSVVLRNNTQDPSSLHERISMRLFARMGVPVSRTAHTRLFVNNEYVGLYLMVESVDTRFLERHFGESAGYLYQFEWTSEYYFEYRGPDPAAYSPSPFRPETHEENPDPAPLVDMIAAINLSTSASFLAATTRLLDVKAFLTQAAIENFLADYDGLLGYAGLNNFYLYRFRSSRPSTFIPWDKSEAFKGGLTLSIWNNIFDVPDWLRNRLMDRAMDVLELRNYYLDTLLACARLAGTDGWLEQEVRRAYDQIRQAALEDPFTPYSNEEFEQDVRDMLAFARERPAFVIHDVERSR